MQMHRDLPADVRTAITAAVHEAVSEQVRHLEIEIKAQRQLNSCSTCAQGSGLPVGTIGGPTDHRFQGRNDQNSGSDIP